MSRFTLHKLAFVLVLLCFACDEDTAARDDGGSTEAACGNGMVEGTELCDGYDLDEETCQSATNGVMSSGVLSCNEDCTFNVDSCTGNDAGSDEDAGGVGGTGG